VGYKHSGVDRIEYYKEWDKILLNAETLYPNDPQVKLSRARYFLRNEDYSSAAKKFSELTSEERSTFEGYLVGGWILNGFKKVKESTGAFQKALSLTNEKLEQAFVYNLLAGAFDEMKDTEKYIAFTKKSLELNPESTWAHGGLVSRLRQMGKWDEAIDEGEKMLKVASFGVGKRQLAEAYHAKAASIRNRITKDDPFLKNPESIRALEESESNYLNGLKHAPDEATVIFNVAIFYASEAERTHDATTAKKAIGFFEKFEKAENGYNQDDMKKHMQNIADGRAPVDPRPGPRRVPAMGQFLMKVEVHKTPPPVNGPQVPPPIAPKPPIPRPTK
jgi:tetratricopeptide (TPR) repeat protein